MAAIADALPLNDRATEPITSTAPSTCSEPLDPCCSTSVERHRLHSPARSLPVQCDDRAKSVPLCDIKNDPCSSIVDQKPAIAMSLYNKQSQNRTAHDTKSDVKAALPSRLVKPAPQRCSLVLPDDCAKKLAALAIRHPKLLEQLGITRIGTESSSIDLISRASRDQDDHWLRMQTPTTSRDTQLLPADTNLLTVSSAIVNATTDMMPRPGSDESRVESGLGSSRASSDNNQSQTSQADSGIGNGRANGIKSPPSRAMSASNFRPPQPAANLTPQWAQPAGRKPGTVAGAPVHHMQQMVQAQQNQEQAQQPSLLVGLLRSSQNTNAPQYGAPIRMDVQGGEPPAAKKRKKKEPSATAKKKAKQDFEKELLAQSMGQAPAMQDMPSYLKHPYYGRPPMHPSVADPSTSQQYVQQQYARRSVYEQQAHPQAPNYPTEQQRLQHVMNAQHRKTATPPASVSSVRHETETPGTPMSGHELPMDSPASVGPPMASQFPQSPADHANVVLSPRTERQINDSIDSVLAMPEQPPTTGKMPPQYHQQARMPPPQYAAAQSQQQSQYPGAYHYAQAAPQYRQAYYAQAQYQQQYPQQYHVTTAPGYPQQQQQQQYYPQQQYYGAQPAQYQYPVQEQQYQQQYTSEQQQYQYAQQRPVDAANYVIQQ